MAANRELYSWFDIGDFERMRRTLTVDSTERFAVLAFWTNHALRAGEPGKSLRFLWLIRGDPAFRLSE